MSQEQRLVPGRGEAGFTLVEALSAIVILVFGLMAVTNLLLVAASSNSVANQGTAATNSASEVLDRLRVTPFTSLPATGGTLVSPVTAGTAGTTCALVNPIATFACFNDVPGVGRVVTQWTIVSPGGSTKVRFIRMRSEGTGALAGARSRSEFTLIRTCSDYDAAKPAGPGNCPP